MEKLFTVIFFFLIPSYPVIRHCVRIHISTSGLTFQEWTPDADTSRSPVVCQVTVHYVPIIDLIIFLLSERMISLE